MEQRLYHGNVSPDGLADFLVAHYNAQEHLRAQKLGQGESLVVQIGQAHDTQAIRHAVTLGIHRAPGAAADLLVTMGEQQWITPQLAGYAAMMALVSVLVTPWALFALIWPVSALLGSRALPGDIWNSVETYVMSQGATPGPAQMLSHPHVASGPLAGGGAVAPSYAPSYPPAPEDAKTQKLDDPRTS